MEAMDTFEAQTGVEPSPIDVYLRGHRGLDPAHLEEQYGQEMVRRHGENFEWRKGPIDPEALHASGGGKEHGWYSMFTGVVDSRDNLQEALRAQNEYNLQQQEYNLQQQEYYRKQQEYFANYTVQQQDWFCRKLHLQSVLQQQHGHKYILPPWRPPPPMPPPPPPPPMLPQMTGLPSGPETYSLPEIFSKSCECGMELVLRFGTRFGACICYI
ncbi:hypothetical protein PVAP13_8KG202503 [Panicum virgatum]|uniref:Uncharacterized protein n=1 Tax=Panicum virgatum TaxID=38727 RepID=A0A8T0PKQ7_PANVG|nr:hypothetical protein PVAP13_8KG202503 [Panicum virgatum]